MARIEIKLPKRNSMSKPINFGGAIPKMDISALIERATNQLMNKIVSEVVKDAVLSVLEGGLGTAKVLSAFNDAVAIAEDIKDIMHTANTIKTVMSGEFDMNDLIYLYNTTQFDDDSDGWYYKNKDILFERWKAANPNSDDYDFYGWWYEHHQDFGRTIHGDKAI